MSSSGSLEIFTDYAAGFGARYHIVWEIAQISSLPRVPFQTLAMICSVSNAGPRKMIRQQRNSISHNAAS